jgi:3D (Asp-Asp-Asp) domain-containing protein
MPRYLRVVSIAAIAVLVLSGTASALSVNWYDVNLTMDGGTKNYRTVSTTVGSFLDEQDVVLGELDTVSPARETALAGGMTTEIFILREFGIIVDIDGKTQTMPVAPGTTAGDVVEKLEHQNNAGYVFADAAAGSLAPNQYLKLNRVFFKVQITEMTLMYDTEIVMDDQIELGEETVERPGEVGEMLIYSTQTLIDGRIVKTQVMREEIARVPVNEIVRQGTKVPLPRIQTNYAMRPYTRMIEMTATAYTAGFQCTGKTPDHPLYGITASGARVGHGIVAVDPRVIPLGTRLYVEGYGESVAADTGGAIIGNKIDLFHEHLDDAIRFGRRTVRVYVLG